MADSSGFHRAVGEVLDGLKKQIEARPIKDPACATRHGEIDREVREQVIADLDKLAERHEKASS